MRVHARLGRQWVGAGDGVLWSGLVALCCIGTGKDQEE